MDLSNHEEFLPMEVENGIRGSKYGVKGMDRTRLVGKWKISNDAIRALSLVLKTQFRCV